MLLSCKNYKLQRELEKFTLKETVVPDRMRQILGRRDSTVLNPTVGVARMVVWADSIACSSCRLSNIFEYDEIIHFREEVGEEYIPIFLFSPPRTKIGEVIQTLESIRFDYPVFIDEKGLFSAANPHIPADNRFHTFLIDKNGKVELFGDPVNNPQLWELYKKTIALLIDNDGILPAPEH
jgi:hypothetical protein